MNASIWGGLPVAYLPPAGALRVVLRFVWLYGNWASFCTIYQQHKAPLFLLFVLIILN